MSEGVKGLLLMLRADKKNIWGAEKKESSRGTEDRMMTVPRALDRRAGGRSIAQQDVVDQRGTGQNLREGACEHVCVSTRVHL